MGELNDKLHDPKDPETCYNKGNFLLNLGRYEEAVTTYDKALELEDLST